MSVTQHTHLHALTLSPTNLVFFSFKWMYEFPIGCPDLGFCIGGLLEIAAWQLQYAGHQRVINGLAYWWPFSAALALLSLSLIRSRGGSPCGWGHRGGGSPRPRPPPSRGRYQLIMDGSCPPCRISNDLYWLKGLCLIWQRQAQLTKTSRWL